MSIKSIVRRLTKKEILIKFIITIATILLIFSSVAPLIIYSLR